MFTSNPNKLHKRLAPSRAGSDFSFSTTYSSSSTLVYEERFQTRPVSTPTKPWAIKALNQLGLKCKKSIVFGKGKKKEGTDGAAEDDDEDTYISPYNKTPQYVLDISREANDRMQELERHGKLDLLPECLPQILRKSPSINTLEQTRDTRQQRLTNLRLGSTPDLRKRPKRESVDEPFYLEKLLHEFPRPPVHKPGEYAPRAPVNPRVRRQNSNFSLPTSKAYPERAKVQARHWIDRPAPRDRLHSMEPPSLTRSDHGH